MPEYLSPGVYVEEISFRKFIEGVSTSTTGIVGQSSFGPPTGKPEVLTSFADYQRTYGGFEDLVYGDGTTRVNYTAFAARAFFENGGKRLYAARVFRPMEEGLATGMNADGVAVMALAAISGTPASPARIVARYPGSWGN